MSLSSPSNIHVYFRDGVCCTVTPDGATERLVTEPQYTQCLSPQSPVTENEAHIHTAGTYLSNITQTRAWTY